MSAFVGIDLGGTQVKFAAVDREGHVIAEHVVPTADDGTASWRDQVSTGLDTLRTRLWAEPEGIGLAAPGLPSPDGHSIHSMPGRLKGLEGFEWREHLRCRHDVPVLNDAQAALLGEVWLGAARGARNALMLTLGTGVGGAAVVDGRLLRGHLGRAGHLGHVSLDPDGARDIVNTPGSLEDAIGDHTVQARSGGRFSSTRDLVSAAHAGDAQAREVWERSIHVLAAAVAGLINVLDPEYVILGGGISAAGRALTAPLAAHLDAFEWRPGGARVRLVPAALANRAGALGAARAAMDPTAAGLS
jgi:glucokinase